MYERALSISCYTLSMKKLWIVTGAIIVLGVVVGGAFFFLQQNTKVISPGEVVSAPTPAVEMATWNDVAGFSFQSPKDLSVNKHEEDPDNYAHVELISRDHPGNIIVWVKDLPPGVTTLDSWVKKLYPGATILDTKLGGEPAKKILTTTPVKMLTVGAISDNLLFSVEGTLTDSEYWSRVHDTVTGSFAFTPASTTAVGESVDEEEVVQ